MGGKDEARDAHDRQRHVVGDAGSGAGRADRSRYAKDLLGDRGLRLIARLFLPTVLVSLALPFFRSRNCIAGLLR